MTTTRLLGRATLAALVGLAPCAARAQLMDRVTVTPYIGWYTPVSALGTTAKTGTTTGFVEKLEQRPELALGANATYWLTRRVALEIGGMFVASDVKNTMLIASTTPGAGDVVSRDAHVVFGTVKIMSHLMPETSPLQIRLGVGPAIVSRGGRAFQSHEGEFTGLTDVGAAVSACTGLPLSDRIRIRLRAENYLYQTKIGFRNKFDPSSSYSFGARFQNDFVLSTGLQMFLGR